MNLAHVSKSVNQDQSPYADAVARYAQRNINRLATPGHQVSQAAQPFLWDFFGPDLLQLDVPALVEGIDYGPYPTPYEQSLELAAHAWGARRTWFLTNGASKGNLMTCVALGSMGDTIVLQRSMHSSVIDGLAFSGLNAHFVFPSVDTDLGVANGVTPESLDKELTAAKAKGAQVCAAYLVTPSYFGAVADVAALARVAHGHGVPLVVDEAWGAHFGFHPELPNNAIRLGADVVISSTHKLGGSFSQSAMLHLGDTEYADALEPLLERSFRSFQSTSVNAYLLTSLDLARRSLATRGAQSIAASLDGVAQMRSEFARLGRFADIAPTLMSYPDVIGMDPLRVAMNTRVGGISGHEARSILLDQFGTHCEMATSSTVVMLIGAGVAPRVAETIAAFHELPENYDALPSDAALELPRSGDRVSRVRDAYFAKTQIVSAKDAVGRVSADSVAAYPPGIPNLLPGELITAETVDFLQATIAAPFGHVRGGASPDMTSFRVVLN